MSDQQTKKLLEEAADIRRRFASETNSELRSQLTARYYQIEAELKAIKTSAAATRTETQSKSATQNSTASITPIEVSEPFGIPLRVPLGQLGIGACDLGNGARVLRTVPKPHSFFDLYIVHTSSDSVVTAVMAFKTIFPVNRYGTELRSQFQLISSRLERIYGEPS